jgi:acyl carrier protein
LRGYRIELGEIETQLSGYPGVKAVVADVPVLDGEMKICAYYTSDKDISDTELRYFLADRLPSYMVPSFFLRIEQLPVTTNGKMNKKLLPKPALSEHSGTGRPADDLERELSGICARILKIDASRVNMNASFAQLGGSSIDAINLIARIEEIFNIRLKLMDLFRISSLRELATLIPSMRLLVSTGQDTGGGEDEVII